MHKELNRMMAGQFQLSSCGNQTYAIRGLVKQGGRRYYKVSRTEVEEGTAQPKLPMTGYIPTRRKMAHMSACSGPGGADFTGECTFGQKRPLTFELQHKGVNIFQPGTAILQCDTARMRT